MPALATPLRRDLERAIVQARRTAETGAANSLTALGYADAARPTGISDEDASLRTALRARGRQLGEAQGDEGVANGRRALVEEIAYEQWHRMLFARFLAENGLLRHPEGATVSLDDCAELAPDEGARDAWDLAARYAAAMLPGLFRASDSPVSMARESYAALEDLVEGLPVDVFTSDDGLGWVYQFWQSERKKQVNAEAKSRGTKIGAAELPAVTQLFTEPYMVDFLLQNTLGAWWAGKYPDSPLLAEMPYLRYADEVAGGGEDPTPQPPPHLDSSFQSSSDGEGEQFASGVADHGARQRDQHGAPLHPAKTEGMSRDGEGLGWGRTPAAGTYGGWAKTVAELKVLDPCCGSGHFLVAAFGWLRRMRRAEEGLSESDAADAVLRDNLFGLELDRRATQISILALAIASWRAGGNPQSADSRPHVACSGLPIGGTQEEWVRRAGKSPGLQDVAARLQPVLTKAPVLGSLSPELTSMRVLAEVNEPISNNRFMLWKEDPEVLQRGVDDIIDHFTDKEGAGVFADSASDFVRFYSTLSDSYDLVATNPPFLSRSSHPKELKNFCARNYPNSKADLATVFVERCLHFVRNGGAVAQVTPQNWLFLGAYQEMRKDLLVTTTINLLAAVGEKGFESTAAAGAFTALVAITAAPPTIHSTFAGLDATRGKSPAHKDRLLRDATIVVPSQAAQSLHPDHRILLGSIGRGSILSTVAKAPVGLMTGDTPRHMRNYWEINTCTERWQFCQSSGINSNDIDGCSYLVQWPSAEQPHPYDSYHVIVGREAWGKRGVAVSIMRDLDAWQYVGSRFDKNIAAIVPDDQSILPALWSFIKSPDFLREVRTIDQKLAVTNRTLAKVPFDLEHWQKVADEKYPDGLPEPHSDDPTQWLFTGHPRGSEQPLAVALARLLGYRWPEQPAGDDGLDGHADPDGIVCLPPVAGEQPAHDRLRALLADAFGAAWSPDTLDGLLRDAGSPGRDIEGWLREDAFKQHTSLFHNRPFLWHVWDGRKDGFGAIVNYHRLDGSRLNKLIYTYLGDWITRQRDDDRASVPGAKDRLDAALDLQHRLILIRDGEAPHDVYVRWKPLHRQPVGWEPDLNDGVRLNIRPFVTAGVLRTKFTVKWGKDRGANPAGADVHRWSEAAQRAAENRPDEIDGALRLNDLHLSLATKRAARAQAEADPETATGNGQRSLVD